MLIKEYRIPLPLTVEEYRIAQLYMIQKKSREESEGEGSAVEIIENRPYTDGPNGSGQYTYKIYHIGRHLPSWFRSIAPKTALEVHEEAWNAYPYTKSRLSVPFVDKFSLEIETYFEPDGGTQENIFKLKPSELRQRELDVIDIVSDHLSGSDYKKEEDPRHFMSEKTGRGPLQDNWITNPPDGVIMCSYKLIKVDFKYWGLQSKVERFIHDYGLRRVMLRAHRQAWTWQDEWVGLTMDDIRRLEKETQLILQKKLGRVVEDGAAEEPQDKQEQEATAVGESSNHIVESNTPGKDKTVTTPNSLLEATAQQTTKTSSHAKLTKKMSLRSQSSFDKSSYNTSPRETRIGSFRRVKSGTRPSSKVASLSRQGSDSSSRKGSDPNLRVSSSLDIKQKRSSLTVFRTMSTGYVSDDEGHVYYSTSRPEWGFDQIAMDTDSDSDLEFFDAKENISGDEEDQQPIQEIQTLSDSLSELSTQRLTSPPSSLLPTDLKSHQPSATTQASAAGGSRATRLSMGDSEKVEGTTSSRKLRTKWTSVASNSFDLSGDESGTPAVFDVDQTVLKGPSTGTADFLFLVFHGGSTLVSQMDKVNKTIDFKTLKRHLHDVTELHYHSAIGRVALRLVPCPSVCNSAHKTLCQLSPIPVSQQHYGEGVLPTDPHRSRTPQTPKKFDQFSSERDYSYSIPLGAIPLLATEFHGYSEVLKKVASKANQVYQEFLKSEEGKNFSGQVCILGDCMGSVLAYDILTSMQSCPSPSPLSPTSPSHSPPPHNLGHSSGMTANHNPSQSLTGEVPRKFLPTPNGAGANKPLQNVRRSPLLSNQRKERSFDSVSLSSSSTSISIIDSDDQGINFLFPVSNFFAFGSPLGLVLTSRRTRNRILERSSPPRPSCTTFYNLFYNIDPVASRLEPLLDERFAEICPISVPSYRFYPTGMAKADSLKETVVKYPYLFGSRGLSVPSSYLVSGGANGAAEATGNGSLNRKKAISSECLHLVSDRGVTPSRDSSREEIKPFSVWWSSNRIDYSLEAPRDLDGATLLPLPAFSHVIHSRYWEAKELMSFILRQVLHHNSVFVRKTRDSGEEETPFLPQESVLKWNKKSTHIKIQRLSSNHRGHDLVIVDSSPLPPTITAKFQYGPLAMASLSKELVEVYILAQGPKSVWQCVGSELTDKHGKLTFALPKEKRLPTGLYPVKFLVKGDHTTANCNLFVVPPHTEVVVFSVDGALASNFSLSAKDIRMKQNAVEVARYWQELGYLIVYITGRPGVQKEYILSFLGAHGFPLGVVAYAETLSTDSQAVKTLFLARLIKEAKMIIHAAYGSQRHLSVYIELGLQPDQIYIISRKHRSTSKRLCQYISEGFDSHLMELRTNPPKRAMYDVRTLTGEASFALPGKPKPDETSRRRPFGFSKRYQRSASTDTHSTYSTTKQHSRMSSTSRQSPGPQTERNVQ